MFNLEFKKHADVFINWYTGKIIGRIICHVDTKRGNTEIYGVPWKKISYRAWLTPRPICFYPYFRFNPLSVYITKYYIILEKMIYVGILVVSTNNTLTRKISNANTSYISRIKTSLLYSLCNYIWIIIKHYESVVPS